MKKRRLTILFGLDVHAKYEACALASLIPCSPSEVACCHRLCLHRRADAARAAPRQRRRRSRACVVARRRLPRHRSPTSLAPREVARVAAR
jgi:hypothetical protein